MKVFWSWQSDRNPKLHHYFVRDALKEACKMIAKDPEYTEADRPEVDHDTKNTAGTPDIASTILTKISDANVFVADLTPVGITDPSSLQPKTSKDKLPSPKYLQNPNVMSELGYAERALGQDKIILVANGAHYPGADALPFDWRHRSGPKTYNLPDGATKAEINVERKRFANLLKALILPILAKQELASSAAEIAWQTHAADDPCVWQGADEPMEFRNASLSMPKRKLSLSPGTRIYARIVPSKWANPTRSDMEQRVSKLGLHMRERDGDWGLNREGALSVWGLAAPEEMTVVSATQWFQKTGEVWAVSTAPFHEYNGRVIFGSKVPFAPLERFLVNAADTIKAVGGAGPFGLRLGAGDISETSWPGAYNFEHFEAVDTFVESANELKLASSEDIRTSLHLFWNKMRDAYGLPPSQTLQDFEQAADLQPTENID